jgi:hypothetical protein
MDDFWVALDPVVVLIKLRLTRYVYVSREVQFPPGDRTLTENEVLLPIEAGFG